MTNQDTILVTGGAGYIGGHTLLALVEAGRKVVVLDDLSTGQRTRIPEGVPFIQGSVGDAELVSRVLRDHAIGSILHFAGSIVAPASLEDPSGYYRNNTLNSLTLIQCAVEAGVQRFLFSSSAAVYAPVSSGALNETAETGPSTPYGWSKLMTEQMLRDVGRATPMNWLALRYFNVAGADPQGRLFPNIVGATHLIAVACEAAVGRRETLPVYGDDYDTADGSCVRDFIHVSDLAQAHVLGLEYLAKGGESGVFNCGYGRGISVFQVAETLSEIIGAPLPVEVRPRRPGDLSFVVADASKLRAATGWAPRHADIREIVGSALAAAQRLQPPSASC